MDICFIWFRVYGKVLWNPNCGTEKVNFPTTFGQASQCQSYITTKRHLSLMPFGPHFSLSKIIRDLYEMMDWVPYDLVAVINLTRYNNLLR